MLSVDMDLHATSPPANDNDGDKPRQTMSGQLCRMCALIAELRRFLVVELESATGTKSSAGEQIFSGG
jgi:hypothetical protein